MKHNELTSAGKDSRQSPTLWRKQLPNKPQDFLIKYNPDAQSELCCNKDDCFFGNYPTLTDLANTYNEKVAEAWVIGQLFSLSEYSGVKAKMEEWQYRQLASIIRTDYGFLKITEIMLFVWQYKAGRFGQFFGAVEPMKIAADLAEFVNYQRANAYDAHEREQRQAAEHEERAKAIPCPTGLLDWVNKKNKNKTT